MAEEHHAIATRAQEEVERKENTRAQDKEPRSSVNASSADPVQDLAKALQGLQQQGTPTVQASA